MRPVSRSRSALLAASLCTLACAAPAAAQSPFVEGPYVDRLVPGSATVHVRTRAAGPVEVAFEAPGFQASRSSADGTVHRLVVSGLPDDARVRYTVRAGARTARGEFQTAPTAPRDVRFLALGDCRDGEEMHADVLARVAFVPDFLLHMGDYVPTGGDDAQWETFFGVAAPMLAKTAIVPVLGNHELIGPGGPARYRERFALPRGEAAYYTFDFAGVRVVVLDSNEALDPASAQVSWAKRALESARAEPLRALFVAVHHGPMSSGRHGGLEALHESGLVDAMRAAGVDVVFSGHDHIYERGELDGLKYVVTGGCGSPLYLANSQQPYSQRFAAVHHSVEVRVTERGIATEATRVDGRPIEACEAARGASFRCTVPAPRAELSAPPEGAPDGSSDDAEAGVSPEEDATRRYAPYGAAAAAVVGLGLLARRRAAGG